MNDLYGAGDGEDVADEEKPQWDDDIDIGDIVPGEPESSSKAEKKKKKKKKKQSEDDNDQGVDIDAMDAEVENMANDEEWDGTEEMRKRVLNKYMDELHELDFNDIVGSITEYIVFG
jgi:protein KRI1